MNVGLSGAMRREPACERQPVEVVEVRRAAPRLGATGSAAAPSGAAWGRASGASAAGFGSSRSFPIARPWIQYARAFTSVFGNPNSPLSRASTCLSVVDSGAPQAVQSVQSRSSIAAASASVPSERGAQCTASRGCGASGMSTSSGSCCSR